MLPPSFPIVTLSTVQQFAITGSSTSDLSSVCNYNMWERSRIQLDEAHKKTRVRPTSLPRTVSIQGKDWFRLQASSIWRRLNLARKPS